MLRFKTWVPLFLVVLVLSVSQVGCALLGGAAKTPPVFGTWSFTMDNGSVTGTLTIREEADGSYAGSVTAPAAGLQNAAMVVESLDMVGPAFTLKATAEGTRFTLNAVVEGDTMTGTNDVVEVGLFDFSATRVPE